MFTVFHLFMPKSESLPVLFALLSNSEQIATVDFYKRVTVSDSLPLLFTKEQCEREPQFHSLAHKKTSDSLEK